MVSHPVCFNCQNPQRFDLIEIIIFERFLEKTHTVKQQQDN